MMVRHAAFPLEGVGLNVAPRPKPIESSVGPRREPSTTARYPMTPYALTWAVAGCSIRPH